MSEIVGVKIRPNALSALFGAGPPSLTKSKKDVLVFAILLARRLIVINWKSTILPCHMCWIRDTKHGFSEPKQQWVQEVMASVILDLTTSWNVRINILR